MLVFFSTNGCGEGRTGGRREWRSVIALSRVGCRVFEVREVRKGVSCANRARAASESGSAAAERGETERWRVAYAYAILRANGLSSLLWRRENTYDTAQIL